MSSMSVRSEHHLRCGFRLAVPESAGCFKEKAHGRDHALSKPAPPSAGGVMQAAVEQAVVRRLFE